MTIVVADSEAKAHKIIQEEFGYENGIPIEAHEIEDGLVLVNTGDR